MKRTLPIITLLLLFVGQVFGQGASPELIEKNKKAVFVIYVLDEDGEHEGTGTGFFISSDGEGLSNYHVLENAAGAVIKTIDGEVYEIERIISRSKEADLIKFKVNTKGRTMPFLQTKSSVRDGDPVFIIGNPLGRKEQEWRTSQGFIGGIKHDSKRTTLLLDAQITNGNSGGPVMTYDGKVVGVASGAYTNWEGKVTQNSNFAVAISSMDKLKPIANSVSTNPPKVEFEGKGGYANVKVITDGDASLRQLSSAPNWLTYTPYSDGSFALTCAKNSGGFRYEDIKITVDSKYTILRVEQAAAEATYIDSDTKNIYVPALGDTKTITIRSDGSKLTCIARPEWVTVSGTKSALKIEAKKNNSGQQRDGVITLSSGDCSNCKINIPITQPKLATYVRLDPSATATFDGNKGGTKDIHVNSDGASYNVVSDKSDWCKVEAKSGYFTITCDPNKGAARPATITITVDDITKTLKVEQSEYRATYLNTGGVTNVKITALGETKTVTINTDGYDWKYSVTPHSPWLIDSKSGKTLTLRAYKNPGNARNATITLTPTSGNVTPVTIFVMQPKEATYIKTGSKTVSFSRKGGDKTISLQTDGDNFTYNKPYWLSIQNNGNTITLKCAENSGSYKRSEKIVLKSDNINSSPIHVKQRAIFNSYKEIDPRLIGLSLGYVQKQWEWKGTEGIERYGAFEGDKFVNGIQAGVCLEPLFNRGFGLNTGVFYERYFAKSKEYTGTEGRSTYNYTMKFLEHSLYVPLHLEYRAHFHENFQIFAYGGASIDYGLGIKVAATETGEREPFFTDTDIYRNAETGFPHKPFNASLDFGVGIRAGGLQLNAGMSRGLLDISSDNNGAIKQNKPLMVSLSWMIPQEDEPIINTSGEGQFAKLVPIGTAVYFISKQWEYSIDKYTEKSGLWEDSKSVLGFRWSLLNYQPNFIFGFGLRTTLNLDGYFSKSFSELALNIPLHIVYRLHFSKNFNLFFESGPSIDCGLFAEIQDGDFLESNLYGSPEWGYPSERLNAYWDFEAGFRIAWFQLSAGISRGLNTVSITDNDGYEWTARQNRNFMVGVSFFPDWW